MQRNSYKKGMALLFAIMVLSIVMAVGLTIVNFVIKEFNIASASRDSVNAVYAADTGIECALLWDVRGHELYTPVLAPGGYRVFATSTPSQDDPNSPIPDGNDGLNCLGIDITSAAASWNATVHDATSATTTFQIEFPAINACALLEVAKYLDGGRFGTTVLSRGYNTLCTTIATDPRTVERAIKVRYIYN